MQKNLWLVSKADNGLTAHTLATFGGAAALYLCEVLRFWLT